MGFIRGLALQSLLPSLLNFVLLSLKNLNSVVVELPYRDCRGYIPVQDCGPFRALDYHD